MKDLIFFYVVLYVMIGLMLIKIPQVVEGPQHVKFVYLHFLNHLLYLEFFWHHDL